MSSANLAQIPQRKKMDLVVTPNTSSTGHQTTDNHGNNTTSSTVRTSPITKTLITSTGDEVEQKGGPQFPLILTSENVNLDNRHLQPTGTPPSSARTVTKTSSSYKHGALPRGATVITSTRGNLSFFENNSNNNVTSTKINSAIPSRIPYNIVSTAVTQHSNNNNKEEVEQFSFVSSSTATGGGGGILSRNSAGDDFQYRVTTKGRKTYIQKVNNSSFHSAIGSFKRQPMVRNENDDDGNDVAGAATSENTSLLGHNNIQHQYGSSGSNIVNVNDNSNSETIDPQHGEVLEITHSADEPIPGLSFFSAGDGFFLPPPQTILPNRAGNSLNHEDENENENGGPHGSEITSAEDNAHSSEYSPTQSLNDFNNRNNINRSSGESNNNNKDGNDGGKDDKNKALATPTVTIREIFSGSKNVSRMFIYNLLDGACFGLWQAAVLPNFMYIIGGDSNAFVGYNAAAQGGCQMVSALIAAYVGDKKIWPKRYLLRLASLVGCVAIAVTVMAVNTRSSFYFWPSSALWGVYMGFSNPASESIFADSVPGGQRVAVYTYKWILQLLSYLVGYITTIIMFSKFGDAWELNEMTPVLYAGLFAHITSMISLWFLHDDFTLDVHKERNAIASGSAGASSVKSSRSHGAPTLVSATIQSSHSVISQNDNNNQCQHANTADAEKDCHHCTIRKANMLHAKITSFKVTTEDNNKISGQSKIVSSSPSSGKNNDGIKDDKNNNAKKYETSRCEITENDKEIIEELEDDAKREKTGDPLLVNICPAFCCCACSRDQNGDEYQSVEDSQKQQQVEATTTSSSTGGICAKMTLVPILVVLGDICQAVGGGVTVRFFPLFFKNDLNVTPVQLAIVSIILCIFAALLSHFLKKFSSKFRRTSLIVIIRVLGSGLMFLLEFARHEFGTKYPMLAYFVLRSALLNSMMGLSRSIIMDFCRKRHRTFFSAMESVSSLSFSGSAAIGGVVADAHGYRSTFGVTAGFYIASALMVLPAGWWVDNKIADKKEVKKE